MSLLIPGGYSLLPTVKKFSYHVKLACLAYSRSGRHALGMWEGNIHKTWILKIVTYPNIETSPGVYKMKPKV